MVLELGKLDLALPAGKLMLAMLAAVAEMERDQIVERTQAGDTALRPMARSSAGHRKRRPSNARQWLKGI
jgi:DNA invertase Pin-like site-specific DNA recombinase